MTTLPSIPVGTHRPPTAARPDSPTVPSVRIEWRVLERDADSQGLRGGDVRSRRIEAMLTETSIVLRQVAGSRELSVLALPACGRRIEMRAGTLLEWTTPDGDGGPPSLRLLTSPGCPPLLRCDLLDRLGIDGGRHEVVQVETIPADDAD
jgi:hypothetical protein